jgi:hypothetical protein
LTSTAQPAPRCRLSGLGGRSVAALTPVLTCGARALPLPEGLDAVGAAMAHIGCRPWTDGIMILGVCGPPDNGAPQSTVARVVTHLCHHLFGQAKVFEGDAAGRSIRLSVVAAQCQVSQAEVCQWTHQLLRPCHRLSLGCSWLSCF